MRLWHLLQVVHVIDEKSCLLKRFVGHTMRLPYASQMATFRLFSDSDFDAMLRHSSSTSVLGGGVVYASEEEACNQERRKEEKEIV